MYKKIIQIIKITKEFTKKYTIATVLQIYFVKSNISRCYLGQIIVSKFRGGEYLIDRTIECC